MSKLKWHSVGEKFFETGVDKAVLFPMDKNGAYKEGIAWHGVTAINESPSGAEVSKIYADNINYLNIRSAEDFKATIEAYTYPKEFEKCEGVEEIIQGVKVAAQNRMPFGLAYRTRIGNDVDAEVGYKIHIIYNASAAPSARNNNTVNENVEAAKFSWELSTTPVAVEGKKPTAHIVIDSRKVDAEDLKAIENVLYGTDTANSKIILPDEFKTIMTVAAAKPNLGVAE
jgi:hypothetical protein|nr:MAG TPA: tail tube protein [Caudoviricetes sp.]